MDSVLSVLARHLAILTVLVVLAGCSDGNHDRPEVQAVGGAAIDGESLRLTDLDGQAIDWWNAARGQVSVVIFTRTDCPISNRYAPEVCRLYEQFHPRGVEFFLIYVDPHESLDAIREHLDEFAYPCPALRDPEHTLVALTGATVTPEAVVFDGERRITYRGRIDDRYADLGQPRAAPTSHDLADALEAMLAGVPVDEPATEAIGCYIADLQ